MAGFGLVVLEKVLVFTKPRSKHQPSRLFVLSGRKDGAVLKHMSFQTLTLTVTSSKEPLRMTMVNDTILKPPPNYSRVYILIELDFESGMDGSSSCTQLPASSGQ